MHTLLKVPPLLKCQLWALIVLVDFDYSRLVIIYGEISRDYLVLWLEDKQDMVNSLASCLRLEVPLKNLALLISPDLYFKDDVYDAGVDEEPCVDPSVIRESTHWFTHFATDEQRTRVQRKLLSGLLTQVIEERLTPSIFQMEYTS